MWYCFSISSRNFLQISDLREIKRFFAFIFKIACFSRIRLSASSFKIQNLNNVVSQIIMFFLVVILERDRSRSINKSVFRLALNCWWSTDWNSIITVDCRIWFRFNRLRSRKLMIQSIYFKFWYSQFMIHCR